MLVCAGEGEKRNRNSVRINKIKSNESDTREKKYMNGMTHKTQGK